MSLVSDCIGEGENDFENFTSMFGNRSTIIDPDSTLACMRKQCFSGDVDHGIRAIYWRIFLGLLTIETRSMWVEELQLLVEEYDRMKKAILPSQLRDLTLYLVRIYKHVHIMKILKRNNLLN